MNIEMKWIETQASHFSSILPIQVLYCIFAKKA